MLPPDLIGHLATVAGDKIVGFTVEKTLGKIVDVASRAFGKRETEAEASGDPERLKLEVERLSETVSALQVEIVANARAGWNWDVARDEASEPAFARFVEEAMDAAASSRAPSKRLMLGRLIARRLQVSTESADELALRRALSVVRDLTESQLLLLAAALLVQHLPSDSSLHFESRDAAELWLRNYCAAAFKPLVSRVPWQSGDFEMLASDGAILMDAQPNIEGNFGTDRDDVEHWLYMHGVPPYDGIEAEWGSNESHALFHARFPTIVALKRLARNGRSDDLMAHGIVARRVDDVLLTPLGAQLASMVLEQLRTPTVDVDSTVRIPSNDGSNTQLTACDG